MSAIAGLAVILGACSTGPTIVRTQEIPEDADIPYSKILVITLLSSFDSRRNLENEVVRHLAETASRGEVFSMGDLLPVYDRADGDQEVPSYQVYLVFAWLRETGVLKKHGRDGYECVGQGMDENGIQELWEQLSPRR